MARGLHASLWAMAGWSRPGVGSGPDEPAVYIAGYIAVAKTLRGNPLDEYCQSHAAHGGDSAGAAASF